MVDVRAIDYSKLDRPEILMFLFHPRPEGRARPQQEAGTEDMMIPVEGDVFVGARSFGSGSEAPNILFFHGNGEIVADYQEIGQIYTRLGINFVAVDYRGYGRSTGRPTVTAMMRDCHVVFRFIREWIAGKGLSGSLFVMGRSLGSASALELASTYTDLIDGLIVESGFARMGPLLELLGFRMEALGISEAQGFRNLEKIRGFVKPTLIIHGERDELLPYEEGKALFEACGSSTKRLLCIPGAGHNDILLEGLEPYMAAVKEWVMK